MNRKLQDITNLVISYSGLLLGFFVTFFRAKIFTPEEIGLLSLIITLAGIFQYIVVLGFPSIILKFFPDVQDDKEETSGFFFIVIGIPLVLFVLAVAVFFISKNCLLRVYHNPLLSAYINYTIVVLFSSSFLYLFDVLARMIGKSVIANILSNVGIRFLNALFLLVAFFVGISFRYYFYFYVSASVLMLFLLIMYLFKNISLTRPRFNFFSKTQTKDYFFYGLFMLISSMAGRLTVQIDKIMLGHYTNLKSLGIYSIAATFSLVIGLVGGSLTRTAHPKISNYLSRRNYQGLKNIYKETLNYQLYFVSFLLAVVIVFAKDLLLFFGPAYIAGVGVIIWIAVGEFVNNATGMCGGIIVLSEFYKFDFYLRIFLLILDIVLNFYFIQKMGITGAAIATALSLILYNILKVLFVYIKFKILPYSRENIKVILSGILIFLFILKVKMYIHKEGNIWAVMIISFVSFFIYNLILKFVLRFKGDIFYDLIFKNSGKDNLQG